MQEKSNRGEYHSVSLPANVVKRVERVAKELGYWPTKTDFVREAVIEKLEKYNSQKG